MSLKEVSFPDVLQTSYLPDDIQLLLPENSQLPLEQQHFLLYIPWNEKYLELVPDEFRDFFTEVLQYLRVRTTDVHTAISLSFLDELINRFPNGSVNRRVLALALILHDSGWSQLSEEEIANSLGVSGLKLTPGAIGPKEKHAAKSEEIARRILTTYQFEQQLTQDEIDLICKAVLNHDKPQEVAGAEQPMPLEVQLLVDLDHVWSFTHENFWQDTVRKGVNPREYLHNLDSDLDDYFVTDEGKELARSLLRQRAEEVVVWENK